MPRTSNRRWKGCCMLCGMHKHAGAGCAERTPFRVLRQMGKRRRVKRTYVEAD